MPGPRAAIQAVFHLPVGHLPIERDDFFAEDRFHPSPAGYRMWGQALGAQTAAIVEAILPEFGPSVGVVERSPRSSGPDSGGIGATRQRVTADQGRWQL